MITRLPLVAGRTRIPLRYVAEPSYAAQPDARERARAADLIVLPDGVTGTSCGNCQHFRDDYCTHPNVLMPVTARECCNYWNAPGTVRAADAPPEPVSYVKDAAGHEHKGKGPGGGQFTGTGDSGIAESSPRESEEHPLSIRSDVPDIQNRIDRIFGPGSHTPESLAKIAGALPGAGVRLLDRGDAVVVKIATPEYDATRILFIGEDGRPAIKNDMLYARRTGEGLGTRVLAQQVREAAAAGFGRIVTRAEKGAAEGDGFTENGYYTWPRLGYDGSLPPDLSVPPELGVPINPRLSDLMKTPVGRAWWKKNGRSVDVAFDLSPNSLSRTVLDAYVAAKLAG